MQLALYFNRVAPTVTNTYGILADQNLLEVVETIFGLPSSFSSENIDVQAKTLTNIFKISDLQNPAKLKQLTERFTASYDMTYGSSSGSSTAEDSSVIKRPSGGHNICASGPFGLRGERPAQRRGLAGL